MSVDDFTMDKNRQRREIGQYGECFCNRIDEKLLLIDWSDAKEGE